ncbi:MAG: UxaA family hydrolase [Bacillota bacterium]|nr:UxaA family hydrolase [Bacillota bacterium]
MRAKEVRRVRAIQVDASDNVVTLVQAAAAGDMACWDGGCVQLVEDVPAAHKVCIQAIPAGSVVTKYGSPIGLATTSIEPGQWVHVHNVRSARGKGAHA